MTTAGPERVLDFAPLGMWWEITRSTADTGGALFEAVNVLAPGFAGPPLHLHPEAEESYDVFDLSGSWSLSERTQIRFGVDNLFDTPPVWTGRRTAQDLSPSTGSGTTEAGFYDILGRSYYVGVKASF